VDAPGETVDILRKDLTLVANFKVEAYICGVLEIDAQHFVCGCDNGCVALFSFRDYKKIAGVKTKSDINIMIQVDKSTIMIGESDGHIELVKVSPKPYVISC
jgi:hypothetical protein